MEATNVKGMIAMDTALIVMKQTIVMFIYMLMGYLLYRGKLITKESSRGLANLLIWLIMPAMLINSFCEPYSSEMLAAFLQGLILSVSALTLSCVLARCLFPKDAIAQFAAAFSNAGFFGIPLVQAAMGKEGVYFVVCFIALLNILQWTYGVRLLTARKEPFVLRELVLNPIVVSIGIGLLIFFSGLGEHMPAILTTTIQGVASMNAPIAMIILGIYLAQTDIRQVILNKVLYKVSAVRLLLIPLLTLLLFLIIPFPQGIRLMVLIVASAPVGANVAVYSQMHKLDYSYATQSIVLSTLFSIISLPLITVIAAMLGL